MDVVGDILASLRLTGGVILEGKASGDWCVLSKMQPEDVAGLFPAGGPVIAYHYVKHGRLWAQVEGQEPVEADEGSILLFPRNEQHRLFTSNAPEPIDSHQFLVGATESGLARFTIDGPGAQTEFFCGFLGVEEGEHPLLDCLPPMLKVDDITEAQESWLESNLNYLAADRPGHEVVARIAELLFAEAIRAYVDDLPEGEGGWLAGLKDPAVARALAYIHAHYAEDLEIEDIARAAGVSRSVLGERFADLLGEPPIRYCARWRMRKAADMLRHGKNNTANVAYAVGFNSEAAFNRAFKREFGLPPAAWKRQALENEAAETSPRGEPESVMAIAKPGERLASCTAADGLPIGFSAMGEGMPVFMPSVWYHEVASDWNSPVWRHWLAEVLHDRQLIRSDLRGAGSSGPYGGPWSLEQLVGDFSCVVEEVGAPRFDLLAFSHGSLVALAYAAANPERVRRIAIVGGYCRGYGVRGDADEISRRTSLRALSRNFKGGDDGTFAQMLGALYWPGARGETVDWFSERLKTIDRLDERLEDVFRTADVQPLLRSVTAETLLLHSRGDRVVSIDCARELAEELPNGRLVTLESDNHVVIATEPAWSTARRALSEFLREPAAVSDSCGERVRA